MEFKNISFVLMYQNIFLSIECKFGANNLLKTICDMFAKRKRLLGRRFFIDCLI